MQVFKPYSIISPPYEIASGGIRVMYALRSWLEIKGQVVYMNAKIDTPFIAVYPEIYQGNIAEADTVVRYILQTPGLMALYGKLGPKTFDPKDKIFVFSKIYDVFGVDDDHLMFLPILNLHLFKNYKKKRNKTCYFVGKGTDQQKHPKNAIRLDREPNQQKLADFLNECQTLYGYDRMSAIYDIARLCGCDVRYYGDFTKDDLSKYEPGLNGMTYRDEKRVKFDPDEFTNHYKGMVKLMDKKIDFFIQETQK